MTFKQPRSIQVVLFSNRLDRFEVLLLKRVPVQGGFWQTITGSLEGDETHREAAQREVMEETSIEIDVGKLIDLEVTNVFEIAPQWRHKYAPEVTHNEEICFAVEVDPLDPIIDCSEHDEYRWVDYCSALEMVLWDSTKRALQAFHKVVEYGHQGI
jgi:dATP pyrophosphohydrolase